MSDSANYSIYYFSGTGNSRTIANWLSHYVGKRNANVKTYNIADIKRVYYRCTSSNDINVIISPVHGFNYPPLVIHFILNFPRGKGKFYLVNTRAGMRIGNIVTPGISGISLLFSALILRLKGYQIMGLTPFDMPSNWISVHPGLNNKAIKHIVFTNRKRVERFSNNLIHNQPHLRGLYDIVQDTLFAPLAIVYYIYGRFCIAKTFIASHNCNKCMRCVKECPAQAIKILYKRPYWTFKCESCMHCMSTCPKKAIETAHGSVIGAAIVFSTLSTLLTSFIKLPLYNEFIQSIITWGGFIIVLAIWYLMLHYLLRFKLIQIIVTYTSLTKYKFWGRRYKTPNLIDENPTILRTEGERGKKLCLQ